MVSSCTEWRKDDEFTDVTLVSGEGKFHKAHKIILSSGSSLLMNILQNAKHPQPLIFLKGIKDHNLKAVLDYLYFGEVTIPHDDLNDFFAEAEEYLLKGFAEINIEMPEETMTNGKNYQNKQFVCDSNMTKPKIEDNIDDSFKLNEFLIPQVCAENIKKSSEEDYILKELGLSQPESAPEEKFKEDIAQLSLQFVIDDKEARNREYLRKLTLQFVADDKKVKRREYLQRLKASKVDKHKVQFEGDSARREAGEGRAWKIMKR